ncbi:sterol desaturase family protein [Sinimarinibacterium sp. CAU 1509]|uniref:sterol desaturase family protein n=1 Tax=Sinimarinibacterium sp. CAU 1509 TaxID=2562283 RepID=UPI00146CC650|nr:sterol desaturase family protein [Sinimarinibacterium sp. CAU 1509]
MKTSVNQAQSAEPVNPTTGSAFFKAFYSYMSPKILTALAVGLIGFRLYLGDWSYADLIAPLCILAFWPVQEWLIHVYLLHMKPRRIFGINFDLSVGRSHRAHHANPSDLRDITINKEVFPTVVPILLGLAYWLFPTIELATGAMATYFALALHYEFCHFLGHTTWCPPIEYYRRRQRMHRLHHYRDEKLWWGVSTGLGDLLLGTAPDLKTVEKSPTVHNVHGLLSEESR